MKKFFKSDDAVPASPEEQSAKTLKSTSVAAKSALGARPIDVKHMLLHPVVSEKASFLHTKNQYIFAVQSETNKILIAKAVEAVYGIKPTAVRISWVRGKTRVRGKRRGRTANWKKAVVTLPAGKTIAVSEGV